MAVCVGAPLEMKGQPASAQGGTASTGRTVCQREQQGTRWLQCLTDAARLLSGQTLAAAVGANACVIQAAGAMIPITAPSQDTVAPTARTLVSAHHIDLPPPTHCFA
jgi:hypothetical protein